MKLFDSILHQPVRSKLVATLIQNDKMPFKALKEQLELTDGNLSTHIKKLEDAGYVEVEKFFEGKRPKTVVSINENGKKAFKQYIKQLQSFIEEN